MGNDSHYQNRTDGPNFEFRSSSECIAWLTILNIEAVAIVTMNALTIIIYLKERTLRKRSMYLVINLAVADMFVTYNVIVDILLLGKRCNFWTITLYKSLGISEIYYYQFGILLSNSFCKKPYCYFFGADARNVSSI